MTTETKVQKSTKISEASPPNLWKVLFVNDDQTPMEFVIGLLTTIFRHTNETANQLTLEIHNTGSAVVGLYTYEIAEQKAIDATNVSRQNNFPLQIRIEEDK
jgi:ATP-dependent Clp protease adaptor protein ClpS